jgi:hypothetical protein
MHKMYKSLHKMVLYKHVGSWIPAYWVPAYNMQGFGLAQVAEIHYRLVNMTKGASFASWLFVTGN